MYHAKHCERRHSHNNMIAQTCLCSFTLSPLRQMGISEGGLSLFWTIAAILVGELQSFCWGLHCSSICEGKLKSNVLVKENIYRHCKTGLIDYNPPFQLSSCVCSLFFPPNPLGTDTSDFCHETIFISRKEYTLMPLKWQRRHLACWAWHGMCAPVPRAQCDCFDAF